MRAGLSRTAVLIGLATAVAVPTAVAQTDAATRAAANPVPKAMIGTWSRYVPKKAFTRYKASNVDVGTWMVRVKRSGLADVFDPQTKVSGTPTISGTIQVTGSRVVFNFGCPTTNRYRWKVSTSGKLLTYTYVNDGKCGGRAAVMTGIWTKRS